MKVVRQKCYNPLENFFYMITHSFNEKVLNRSQQISYANHQLILAKISYKSQHLLITSSISDYSLSLLLIVLQWKLPPLAIASAHDLCLKLSDRQICAKHDRHAKCDRNTSQL